MKIVRQLPFAMLLSAVGLFAAAPAPNSVQNPGSNFITGMPNYGIAQGSVFVVYGTGLGPSTIMGAPSLPLQQTLGGTSITVTVNGTTVNALMNYTYATQVAAILPSTTPVGTGVLTVTYNNVSGNTPITVVASNFGILSVSQTGTGAAVATHGNYSVISGTSTANTGEEIIIWGTGLGPLPTGISDATAPGANGANIGNITIFVGGVQVPVGNIEYHGRNPSDPGLDQINFTIPTGVTGCNVSLVLQTVSNAVTYISNTTTIAISQNGNTCSDASGVSYSQLDPFLTSNGTVRIGTLSLSQSQFSVSFLGQTESETSVSASGNFEKYTGAQLTGSTGVFSLPSIGSCTILVQYPNTTTTPTLAAIGLDAGTPIALTGPTSAMLAEETALVGKGYYSAPAAPAAGSLASIQAGTYTFTGPGGADVGAFMASLKVPVNFVWTDEPVVSSVVSRSQGLNLTWSGGDPSSFVYIVGISSNPVGDSNLSVIFYCIAPVAPGAFTVPTAVLLSLPATSTSADNPGLGLLELGTTTAVQPFTAFGLDVGYATASFAAGVSVVWQ